MPGYIICNAKDHPLAFEVRVACDKSQSWGDTLLFEKSRHLRGVSNAGAKSGVEDPAHIPPKSAASSYQVAANDTGAAPVDVLRDPEKDSEKARRYSGSWPFARALWLGLLVSAVLWVVIVAIIRHL